MNELAKHETGNAALVERGPRTAREATPKRERNSTLVATAPGVLIHRIGDDDAMPEAVDRAPRRSRSADPARGGKEAEKAGTPRAATTAAPAAPRPMNTAMPSTRVATVGPAYSLPRTLRAAVQRAREAQPRLINMADGSYAGAEE
jgi:hypothetical protein